jgi:hypothetical protein
MEVSAISKAEQDALMKAMPYKTLRQRKALMLVVLLSLPDVPRYAELQGYTNPGDLLCHLLSGALSDSNATLKQAIDRLARKSGGYGAKHGELGTVKLFRVGAARFVRWAPPNWPGTPGTRLTLERLLEALATNSHGQAVPSWLEPAKCEPMAYRLEKDDPYANARD